MPPVPRIIDLPYALKGGATIHPPMRNLRSWIMLRRIATMPAEQENGLPRVQKA